jgi:hypothetical protein
LASVFSLSLACVTSTNRGDLPRATPLEIDQAASRFILALQAEDYVSAVKPFDATLRKTLAVEDLRGTWLDAVKQHGPLEAFDIVERTTVGLTAVRVLALHHTRGELSAQVAFQSDTHEMVGFFLTTGAASNAKPVARGVRSVHLSLGSEPFDVDGILTLPAGEGPFPAVVLVRSGASESARFRELAEALAARGIAGLRCEKATASGVEDELVLDGVAATDALRARPDIERARLFVIGEGDGAALAPEVARRAAPLAGLALLSPAANDDVIALVRALALPTLVVHRAVEGQSVEPTVDAWRAGLAEGPLVKLVALPVAPVSTLVDEVAALVARTP